MTMSLTPKEVEYLAHEIFENEKPVAYHKFSRQLNIPIDKAKIWLYEYYGKNRDKLAATFLISGTTETGRTIRLSKDESNLDEDAKKFTSISTIHVYSVGQRKFDFSTNDLALEESKFPSHISKLEQYEKNGIIIGPKIVVPDVVVQPSRPSTTTKTPKESTPESKQEKPRSNVRSAAISASYVSRKAQPKTESKINITSHYTSRKQESVPKKRASTEPTYQYKSRKVEAKVPKERVVIADHNDEDDIGEESELRREKISTVDLEKLFEDDFTDSDDANDDVAEKDEPILIAEGEQKAEAPEVPEVPEVPKVPPPRQEEETKEIPVEIAEIERSPTPDTQEIQEIQVPTDTHRIEKKVDADGYITTRKANPVTKPAKSRSRPTPTKAIGKKAGDGKKVQASVMSFFRKR